MALLTRYDRLVKEGLLKSEQIQLEVIKKMQSLYDMLSNDNNVKSSWKNFWFGSKKQNSSVLGKQGLYIFGGVGSGKTMLMDMFYSSLPFEAKQRVHYNAFMLGIHAKLHELKGLDQKDPMSKLANEFAKRNKVLCLDEFQVVDVADAMLLRNILERFMDHGITFVLTSNRDPRELFLNGIQRASFIPCIDLLERRLDIVNLKSGRDYRMKDDIVNGSDLLFYPVNNFTHSQIESFLGNQELSSRVLWTHGRSISIQKCNNLLALFTFDELCKSNMSAADYLCIANNFDTVVLTDVPIMDGSSRDEARRFITLIDILYDHKIRLVMQSEAEPKDLFHLEKQSKVNRVIADELGLSTSAVSKSALFTGAEEIFATHRTVSRLTEMSSSSTWPPKSQ